MGDGNPLRVRKTPCASCPYRQNAPSGIWDPSEYEKLPRYDGDMADQATAGATRVFGCHQTNSGDEVCAGWVGHRRHPSDLLALRISSEAGPEVFAYTTDVPLFSYGAEAAVHGLRDLEAPSARAQDAIRKITRKKGLQ